MNKTLVTFLVIFNFGFSYGGDFPLIGTQMKSLNSDTHAYGICQRGIYDFISDDIWHLKEAGTCHIQVIDKQGVSTLSQDNEIWSPVGWLNSNEILALRETRKSLVGDSQDRYEIHKISTTGKNSQLLFDLSYPGANEYSLSPNGNRLIFGDESYNLYLYDIKENKITPLDNIIGKGFAILWQPDSHSFYFRSYSDRNIYQYHLKNQTLLQITDFQPNSAQLRGRPLQKISRDGNKLLVLYSKPAGPSVHYSLWHMDKNGDNAKEILNHNQLFEPMDFDFTPDNQSVFYVDGTPQGEIELYLANFQDKKPKKVEQKGLPQAIIIPSIHGWKGNSAILPQRYNIQDPHKEKIFLSTVSPYSGVQKEFLQ